MLLQCYFIPELRSGAATRCSVTAAIYSSAATRFLILQQMCNDADPVGVYGIVSCFVKEDIIKYPLNVVFCLSVI